MGSCQLCLRPKNASEINVEKIGNNEIVKDSKDLGVMPTSDCKTEDLKKIVFLQRKIKCFLENNRKAGIKIFKRKIIKTGDNALGQGQQFNKKKVRKINHSKDNNIIHKSNQ